MTHSEQHLLRIKQTALGIWSYKQVQQNCLRLFTGFNCIDVPAHRIICDTRKVKGNDTGYCSAGIELDDDNPTQPSGVDFLAQNE